MKLPLENESHSSFWFGKARQIERALFLSNANGGTVSASIQNLSHPSKIYDEAESEGITVITGVLYVIDPF